MVENPNVWILVKAIQELKKENEIFKKENVELKEQIATSQLRASRKDELANIVQHLRKRLEILEQIIQNEVRN